MRCLLDDSRNATASDLAKLSTFSMQYIDCKSIQFYFFKYHSALFRSLQFWCSICGEKGEDSDTRREFAKIPANKFHIAADASVSSDDNI